MEIRTNPNREKEIERILPPPKQQAMFRCCDCDIVCDFQHSAIVSSITEFQQFPYTSVNLISDENGIKIYKLFGGEMEEIERILRDFKVVAVVGLSPNPQRPSHWVARYLKEKGYKIVPVNPMATEILEERAYPSLSSIPFKVEVVDIFRRPEEVGAIVDEAISIGAKAIWMQEGIINEEAAERARKAGLKVVMDRCMMQEHQRIFGEEGEGR